SGRPTPRIAETSSGMLNSIGLQGPGITAFLDKDLAWLHSIGARVVVSIAGNTAAEFAEVARALASHPSFACVVAVEINISCPNVANRGLVFACDPMSSSTVVGLVHQELPPGTPTFAKLTPDVTDIVAIADAALQAGATGLTMINTLLGIVIDTDRLRPQLAGITGGLSGPINVLVLLTVITLVPSIMLMTTCFVRIVVVLGLVKQAMGTQTLPPPQVILGLSLFMTLVVMSPTLDRLHKEAIVPYNNGEVRDYGVLWERARRPIRDFMFDQIEATGNWSSVYMMLNYRGIDTSEPDKLTTDDVDMVSLIPAFMLSELKTAFLIGFKVYLPFLVIDMVIASLLISMGMMMLPPVLISMPFKLLLFVLVDGWTLIVGSLMTSFTTHPTATAAWHAGAQHVLALAQVVTGYSTG
ncbi:MAG TPA: flagellar type III secretion system pore protein FliP, partial [Phycisphaerales bacterium]|nr:flagellar type III secretion system pore protein FliP [Phycisphaerales bacterium]